MTLVQGGGRGTSATALSVLASSAAPLAPRDCCRRCLRASFPRCALRLRCLKRRFRWQAQSSAPNGVYDAAKAGDVNKLREILHGDPRATTITDSRGRTALHAAAERGNLQCVHLLLEVGAETDAVDNVRNVDSSTPQQLRRLRFPATSSRLPNTPGALTAAPTHDYRFAGGLDAAAARGAARESPGGGAAIAQGRRHQGGGGGASHHQPSRRPERFPTLEPVGASPPPNLRARLRFLGAGFRLPHASAGLPPCVTSRHPSHSRGGLAAFVGRRLYIWRPWSFALTPRSPSAS